VNRSWPALDVRVTREAAEVAAAALWSDTLLGIEEDPEDAGHLVAYYREAPDAAAMSAALEGMVAGVEREGSATPGRPVSVRAFSVDDEDWLRLWKRDWKPTPLGERLVVVPAWWDGDLPAGREVVWIEPGRAFGTGTHETTALAWELLEIALPHVARGARLLDIGTGTGVLALGALRLRPDLTAIGTELDEQAVDSLRHNLAINPVERFTAMRASALPVRPGSMDVIVSNLTAAEQAVVDVGIREAAHPGTELILSGFLHHQISDTRLAWLARGAVLLQDIVRGEWRALRMRLA